MQNIIAAISNWPFLNEPAYRWVIFFMGFMAFLFAWNGVISFMK